MNGPAEKADLLLEGVHIVPNARMLKAWEDAGGVALGVVMVVDETRSSSHAQITGCAFLSALGPISGKLCENPCHPEGLIERAKIANWPTVDLPGLRTTSNASTPF